MEPQEPPQWGTFAIGPCEARVMQALINGIGYALPRAMRDIGQTPESREALEAIKRMNGPEYDAVMTFAAAIVLPVVLEAFSARGR